MKTRHRDISEEVMSLIAARFRVLAEPTRLKLLHRLEKNEMSVGELVEEIGGSQANVSKHLGILFDAGLLSRRKNGVTIFYRVADESVFDLCDTVCTSLGQRLVTQQNVMKGFDIT